MSRADDAPAAAKKKAVIPLMIEGDTVIVVKSLPCTVTAPAGADLYFWSLPDAVKGTAEDNVLTVTAAPAGDSTITVVAVTIAIAVDKDGKVTKVTKKDAGSVILTNGMAPPTPPVPPEPPVPPVPPGPPGLRVLIVYDATKAAQKGIDAILKGAEVRTYLASKCAKGADGKTPEYRVWDKDTDVSAEAKTWQDAMARPRVTVPWILISDGAKGYEGPLPATVAETMALLKKYGGK